MDKEVLIQYCEMAEEIKDIRRRIIKLETEISKLQKEVVADTVKGTRKDGTYGPIKIEGIQSEKYYDKQAALEKLKKILEVKEIELLELQIKSEEYIESIPKSEMRTILRLSIIDGLTNAKVAQTMNRMFPKRPIKYTDENIKKKIQRFFENVPQCPVEM